MKKAFSNLFEFELASKVLVLDITIFVLASLFNVVLVVCKQLVLKVNKTKEDKAEEASRNQLLKFLNSSYD